SIAEIRTPAAGERATLGLSLWSIAVTAIDLSREVDLLAIGDFRPPGALQVGSLVGTEAHIRFAVVAGLAGFQTDQTTAVVVAIQCRDRALEHGHGTNFQGHYHTQIDITVSM